MTFETVEPLAGRLQVHAIADVDHQARRSVLSARREHGRRRHDDDYRPGGAEERRVATESPAD